MIYGIGTDIIQIPRIEAALLRYGDRFTQKILGAEELAEFAKRKEKSAVRGDRFVATRFAVKEAFSKAVGLGMRAPMSWCSVQTLNASSGQPILVLSGDMKEFMTAHNLSAHVSITDESDYAVAFVVVEKTPFLQDCSR